MADKLRSKQPFSYRYPAKMFDDETDYISIRVVRYESIGGVTSHDKILSEDGTEVKGSMRNIEFTSGVTGRRNSNKSSKGTILLPIPSNVQDSMTTKYGDSSLNSFGSIAMGGIMDAMNADFTSARDLEQNLKKGFYQLGEAANDTITKLKSAIGGVGGIQGYFSRQLTAQAMGILGSNITPEQILTRATGEIMNPNMELLFNGPTLRTFRFQYKMVPRSKNEADHIKNIIRTFKKHMVPKVQGEPVKKGEKDKTGHHAFLRTPDVFELTYKTGGEDHKFLNRFKQCFLSNMSVNYTGEGTYATYEDGTPVSIILDLTFQEIVPIYDIDYNDESEETGVGY